MSARKPMTLTQKILCDRAVGLKRPWVEAGDTIRIKADWTVERALEHIRNWGHDAETVHWVFVVDEDQRLIDDIHIRRLLLTDPQTRISSLMDETFIALNARVRERLLDYK